MRGGRVLASLALVAVLSACTTFGSSSSDPTPPADGGASADAGGPAEGGAPADGGSADISCTDTLVCEAPSFCCVRNGFPNVCGTGCNSDGELQVYCDDPTDCPGAICCMRYSGPRVLIVQCEAQCTGTGALVVCPHNAPDACGPGKSCLPDLDVFEALMGGSPSPDPTLLVCQP